MIYLSNDPYPQEISIPRSFGVIVPRRTEYLTRDDIATDLETDTDRKVLAASQGVRLKEMIDGKADANDVYTKTEVDDSLDDKADKADTYTKQQVDSALAQVSQTYETKADATAKETALQTAINGKQDKINDLQTIRDGAAAGATAYQKPSSGIPASDLAQGVIPPAEVFWAVYGVTTAQELSQAVADGKQLFVKDSGYICTYAGNDGNYHYFFAVVGNITYRRIQVQISTNSWARHALGVENIANKSQSVETDKTSTTKYPSTKAVADALAGKQDTIDADHKLDYSLLDNTPSIPAAQVPADWDATTGVSRILNKPTIPAAPVNADWNADSGLAQILNKPTIPTQYAGSPTAGGFASKAVAIPFGQVDAESTATEITATVDNFPETLTDGVCAFIRNNVVASASGWTLNINGTGAKPVYASNADATRTSTIFTAAVTYLFIYNSTRVEGGCWDMYYGYNANDNTIGYNLRTNAMSLPTTSACYRYRLLFTSADRTHFVPANSSTSTNATAKRTTTSTPIDPFGSIRYYGTTTAVSSGARPGAAYLWEQYSVTLGYSFNRTGAALTLTAWKPVYIKCTPQTDGSAIIDAETPYVQDLPTTADGKIYIHLGVATSATQVEVVFHHPVYYIDQNGRKRVWTGEDISI